MAEPAATAATAPVGSVLAGEITQLLVSPVHRYDGRRPKDGPAPAQPGELVDVVTVEAGLGIVGDRYHGVRPDAAVTIMAAEAIPFGADLLQTRRNILFRSIDVVSLIGSTIRIDSPAGSVSLRVDRTAPPCTWMDLVIAPGARAALRGLGGARCEPLTSGRIGLGPVRIEVLPAC